MLIYHSGSQRGRSRTYPAAAVALPSLKVLMGDPISQCLRPESHSPGARTYQGGSILF